MAQPAPPSPDGPIDLDDLRGRVSAASEAAGHGVVSEVTPMAVFGASLTYRARFEDGTDGVVKVAPPGLEPVRNRDVLRQARAIKAAATVPEVPVPSVLFEDAGDPPETPPLFVMTFVLGDCMEPIFGGFPLPPPEEVRGRALSAARILGALHRIDPASVGLDEPPVGLRSEVDRWVRAFTTVPDSFRGGSEEVGELLVAQLPPEAAPTLVHGDYRLGNTLCAGAEVQAVIDWEIWSVSDPRIDLAWFLLHRDHKENPNAAREAPGMPSTAELLQEYATGSDREVSGLTWFHALVRFKQAAIGALIWKRVPAEPKEMARREHIVETEVGDALAILRGERSV